MARPRKQPIEPEEELEELEEPEERPKQRKVYQNGGSVITLTEGAFERLMDSFKGDDDVRKPRTAKNTTRKTAKEDERDDSDEPAADGKRDEPKRERPNRKHWLFG